ncbi:sacsin N-terminal ATP-binding-like domain-containing protein [Pseudonocardia spirodelae]|uniref:Molecular chaperone Hsp90 n=1 Tax=Pseudonocardia spirodelae TaxID=3133431 RepID=A0ABU8TAL8_9PSEU
MLAAWSSSPTRFREDVNTEDDLRRGGYADTWVAELLQNAADAALAAGVPGRVRVTVADGPELRVANTGAPLDAAGVAALAALRASAKRDDAGATGRFGVGFAAVLALCTAPRLVTAAGGVAFSADRTAAAVARLGGAAAAELARDPRVPVLRLAWPAPEEEPPPPGFATEVRLRPDPGGRTADELLDEVAATAADLLLALPGLESVTAGAVTVARTDLGDGRVRVGDDTHLLVTGGSGVRWALPLRDGRPAPYGPDAGEVLHAPTRSAEQLSLPARLLAPFPLDPDRRRIRADDPAVDALVGAAAAAYAELLLAVAPAERTALVPAPGFPRSPLDARLHEALAATLARTPWLPAAGGQLLAPERAEWLDVPGDGLPELLAAAGPAFARLVASGTVPPAGPGTDRVGAAGLADRLTGVEADPAWWHGLYAALAPAVDAVPGLARELGALPVPLADGRLVPGPASVLLGVPDGPDAAGVPALRLVHPGAAHPLLRRLGAADADRATLLAAPALLDAVERSVDDAESGLDTTGLARTVLALLGTADGPDPRWGALALTDDEGRPARADELVLPDAAVRGLLDPDAPVGVLGPEWARTDRDALVAAGVLDGFTVGPFDPDRLHDAQAWLDEFPDDPGDPADRPAVRDLDLVDDDRWPEALALLAAGRDTRAAVLTGYTAWWLARHVRIGGRLAGTWRLRSAAGLAGLYDPVPELPGVDEAVLAAVGVRARIVADGPDEVVALLDRLADPSRTVTGDVATAAHAALAAAVADGRADLDGIEPPERVRTVTGAVAPADRAVVLDAPWVLPALGGLPAVGGGDDPDTLAELLDLPLASARVSGRARGAGTAGPWTADPEVVLALAALGVGPPAGRLHRHDELVVDLDDGGAVTVPAWPGRGDDWHASDPLRALVAALAAARRVRMPG